LGCPACAAAAAALIGPLREKLDDQHVFVGTERNARLAIENMPFRHIAKLAYQDRVTSGGLIKGDSPLQEREGRCHRGR